MAITSITIFGFFSMFLSSSINPEKENLERAFQTVKYEIFYAQNRAIRYSIPHMIIFDTIGNRMQILYARNLLGGRFNFNIYRTINLEEELGISIYYNNFPNGQLNITSRGTKSPGGTLRLQSGPHVFNITFSLGTGRMNITRHFFYFHN